MTAPTPERRVGERLTVRQKLDAIGIDASRDHDAAIHEALDRLSRLTAEVERLTKEKARASQMAFEEGAVWGFTRPTGAAIQAEAVRRYPLPTPAPEATE